jgi:hypothetical protein
MQNVFLKAVIQEAYDLEQAGEDLVGKKWTLLVSAGIKCGMDLPAVIQAVSSAKSDLEALLKDPTADLDLLTDVVGIVGHQGKAAACISASADLALSALSLEPKVVALIDAIKAPVVVDPAPAA